MQYEIRDGRLHLTGYVNAVERDSKEIMTKRGRCVEQIRSGAFAKSLERNPEVRMKLNHKRTVSADMTLREDTIGLHVEADTDDEEIMALAAKGELRGWSFGFEALDDEIEQRDGRTPRRIVKDLDLSEVSVLSVTPAYNGTSLEYRSEDMCGDDSAEDVPAEDTAAETEETQADDMPVDDVSEESPVTLTDEQRAEIEQAKAYVEHLRRIGELERIRAEQRELEERYNHYHDPKSGRFASGKDGGMGLYYSMGKGKGEVVGAASDLVSDAVKQKVKKFAKHFGFDENNVTVQRNADGNYEVTGTKTIHKDKMTFSTIGAGDIPAHDETTTLTYILDKNGNKIGIKRKSEGAPFSLSQTRRAE